MINACQRHLCTNYCQRKDKQGNTICPLAYPQKLRANSVLAVKQTVMTKKGGHHTSVEIVLKRNDKWINSHCRPLLQHWQANVDMRLTIDVGKIVAYMTKYITKTETNTHNTQRHFSQFYTTLDRIAGDCERVENVFKKFHTELHGSRSKSIQEVCHCLMSIPLVVSDHSFTKINLLNDNSVIEPDEEAADGDGALSSRMTIIDAYAVQLDEESWKKPQEYLQAIDEGGLPTMSLNSFCQKYTVGKRGGNCRNKITLHRNKDKWVARFHPQLPSNVNSPDYFKYCKLQLIRYRPWVGDYDEAAGGVDSTPQQTIAQWEAFALSFAQRGMLPPHHMQSAIKEIMERMSHDAEYRTAVAGHDDLLMDEGGGASVGTGDSDELPVGEMEFSNLGVDSVFGMEEEDTVEVPWHSDHDWAATETDLSAMRYEDPLKEFDVWRKGNAASLPADFVDTAEAPVIHRGALNEKQQKFMEVMDRLLDPNHVSSTDSGGPGLSRCMVLRGRGGTGKSHCMRCLQSELPEEQVRALATTGKAATVLFHGSTVYSQSNGLALPVGKSKYTKLNTQSLRTMQEKWKHVKVMFVDEMTMLKPQDLLHINLRLQEVKACGDRIFGGIIVVLVGDTAQLPPVLGIPLWGKHQQGQRRPRMTAAEEQGINLYLQNFTTVIELTENNRLQQGDPDVAVFDGFLNRLADGKCTSEDWLLAKERSHSTIGVVEWERRGFTSPGVIHLYSTNKEVENHNLDELKKRNKPILRIAATNNCSRAQGLSSERFNGLQNSLHVCIDSTVVLTTNLWPEMGLLNGSTGIIKDIEFRGVQAGIANRIWNPDMLPFCIWVDFGHNYHGPSFFLNDQEGERRGWVPISPMSVTKYVRKTNSVQETSLTRTMIPLKLAWAWTIWKVQGQTVDGKVVVNLGRKEAEHGVSYVAFSRVRRFQDIGIVIGRGVSRDRLTSQISKQEKLKHRLAEDTRLNSLETHTLASLLPTGV